MKLVVAEKPSVARDIAAVIGADEKVNGALKGNGYIVTSARGHLVRLKDPTEYDERYQKWALNDLPIVPEFEFTPVSGAEDCLDALTQNMLSSDVDEIICATDAGREGECIFRYIYDYIGCTKPVKRLWISSLTVESIKQGFNNLLSSSEKDSVYAAGLARNKVDWLFGMNLSRLYSIYCSAKCSVGRVQTAVVNMIVQRDREIAAFVKKPYFKLKLENGAEWFDGEVDSFAEQNEAEAVKAKCENQLCTVKKVDTKLKKENRPLLFSLTSLQAEANDKLGFSAATTLTIMQSLYEKKLLTYPRTDSNYITDDMAPKLEGLVKKVRFFDEAAADELILTGLNIDTRVVNNAKVSDHHAILPTEYIDKAEKIELTKEEKAILDMVIRRFLAVLSQEYQYNETAVIFDVNGETFRCKYKVPVKLGWKRFYPGQDEDNGKAVNYTEGENFEAKDLTISECETQPPKHYTESTLLKAMENIDRRIEDKELSSYVSERGLGTPATRAAIIERIITVGYIKRSGKSLLAEEKGVKLIDILPEGVKNIEMTASMEQQLSAIEKGSETAENVIAQTIQKVRDIITLEAGREHVSLAPPKISLGKCPKCGGSVYEFTKNGNTVYYCENSPAKCFFRLWADDKFFTTKGKKLTSSIVKSLLAKGKVKLSGLKSERTGATYDAIISFSDKDYKDAKGNLHSAFSMEFDNSKKQQKTKDKKKGG